MKMISVTTAMLLAVCLTASSGFCDTKKGDKVDGKRAFEEHCAVCHPDGGNTINAQKPLNRKSLRANGVKSVKDIIVKIRNPGPGMTSFDKETLPDKEAKAIADYIMKAFK